MSYSSEQPSLNSGHAEEGRPAALAVWALYILSIPSANLLVLVGLVVAYAARSGAVGLPRQNLDAQIALFWSVAIWTILLWVLLGVSILMSFVLIGIPFVVLFGILLLLVSIWFTVKSIFGLLNLLSDKPA